METLTSYVRERSPWPPKAIKTHSSFVQTALETIANNETQSDEEIPPLAIDIQAVMTVIARRKNSYGHPLERYPLDLHGVDLRRLHLLPKTQLNQANFSGTNLQGAFLKEVNLQEATFCQANLRGTFLKEANMQQAILLEANLQEAELEGKNLQEAILWEADLKRAVLKTANLRKAIFEKADLREAYLQDAIDLTWEQLNRVFYEGAILPDYLLSQPPQVETTQFATQATESVQAEGETE